MRRSDFNIKCGNDIKQPVIIGLDPIIFCNRFHYLCLPILLFMIINERSKEKNMQKQIALLRGINVSGKIKLQ